MSSTVDVIVPCFNQGHFVGAAIESALHQTLKPQQIIVVDDGSTDDTRAVCSEYGSAVTYIHQENAGLSAARNTGITRSAAEFVQLLDADDLLQPDALADLTGKAAENSDCSAVRGGWDEIDASGSLVATVADTELGRDQFHALFEPLAVGPPCRYLIRRAAFADVGVFDTALRSCEDWDMWLRFALGGHRFASSDATTCVYRRHSGSMSRNHRRMWESGLDVLKRARSRHNCDTCVDAYRQGVESWRAYCYLSILRDDIRRDVASRRVANATLRVVDAVRRDPKVAWLIGTSVRRNLRSSRT